MREGCKLSSVEGPLAIRGLYYVIRSTNSVPSFSDYLFLQAVQELSQHQPTGRFLLSKQSEFSYRVLTI